MTEFRVVKRGEEVMNQNLVEWTLGHLKFLRKARRRYDKEKGTNYIKCYLSNTN